ncbi:MAG: transposase [Roseiflexaceae bacterium]|nr:transposase [Roseiflexaceae bacterium]
MKKVIGDSVYGWNEFTEAVRRLFHFVPEIVSCDRKRKGWYVLPKRWIVERTFGWFGRLRLLNREYERRTASNETDIYIASIQLMLSRLNRTKST